MSPKAELKVQEVYDAISTWPPEAKRKLRSSLPVLIEFKEAPHFREDITDSLITAMDVSQRFTTAEFEVKLRQIECEAAVALRRLRSQDHQAKAPPYNALALSAVEAMRASVWAFLGCVVLASIAFIRAPESIHTWQTPILLVPLVGLVLLAGALWGSYRWLKRLGF